MVALAVKNDNRLGGSDYCGLFWIGHLTLANFDEEGSDKYILVFIVQICSFSGNELAIPQNS